MRRKARAAGRSARRTGATPVRGSLVADSSLLPRVAAGLGAVKDADREHIDSELRPEFADSLDIDEAFRPGHEQEHRWDYLLGHGPRAIVVAVEPHSARRDQISTVIAKRAAAKTQLAAHLRRGAKIAAWLWVASSEVFADTERAKRRLEQHGILLVGKTLMRKHLPAREAGGKAEGR
ncbi:MAG: hypothetical protein QME96_15500 [Myxococcota bacterium]|nr:hypothetical protein [Myxococcota bacterium]